MWEMWGTSGSDLICGGGTFERSECSYKEETLAVWPHLTCESLQQDGEDHFRVERREQSTQLIKGQSAGPQCKAHVLHLHTAVTCCSFGFGPEKLLPTKPSKYYRKTIYCYLQ